MSWVLLTTLLASSLGGGAGDTPALDNEGFPLPAGATARLGSLRFSHDGEAKSLFFWASGRQIVGSEGDHVVIWDSETGRRIQTLPSDQGILDQVVGSPDGKLIVSAGENETIKVWDGSNGRPLREFSVNARVDDLVFSPDSRSLAIVKDGLVEFRKMPDGAVQYSMRVEQGGIDSIAFSPDGKQVATASLRADRDQRDVQLWDLKGGCPRPRPLDLKGASIIGAFSPDGSTLLTLDPEKPSRLWSLASGHEIRVLKASYFARFAPDGRSIASVDFNDNNSIHILDARTGRVIHRLGPGIRQEFLVYSPDGKRLAAEGEDNGIRIWDVATEKETPVSPGHEASLMSLAYSPDGRRLASNDGNTMILWEVAAGTEQHRIADPDREAFLSVAFAPDGESVAAGMWNGDIAIFDARTGTERLRFMRKSLFSVYGVAFTPSGKLLGVLDLNDGTAGIWDVRQREDPLVLDGGRIFEFGFDRSRRFLATGGADGRARLWDTATGRELRRFEHTSEPAAITAVALRPDGWALASGTSNGSVRVWDVKTKHVLVDYDLHSTTNAMMFSPDGTLLATGCFDGSIHIWDQATGRELAKFNHGSEVNTLDFAPDGQSIASGGGDGMILIWGMPRR